MLQTIEGVVRLRLVGGRVSASVAGWMTSPHRRLSEESLQDGRDFGFTFGPIMRDVLLPPEMSLDRGAVQTPVIKTLGEVPELAMSTG